MAKLIGIAVVVLVLTAVAFIATRPDRFRIERSAEVHAPPDVVYAFINDFHQWGLWSPYEKIDPQLKRTFEGPDAGPGAIYGWVGPKIGEGRMTILETRPGEFVSIRLEFTKPFAGTNHADFILVPSAQGTRVSWVMTGENTLLGKAMSAFVNMDAMIGKAFEEGLAALDTVAHAEVKKRPQASRSTQAQTPEAVVMP